MQEAIKRFGADGGSIINRSSIVGSHPVAGALLYVTTTARDSMWGPTFPELVEACPALGSSTDRRSMRGMIPRWPQRSRRRAARS